MDSCRTRHLAVRPWVYLPYGMRHGWHRADGVTPEEVWRYEWARL